MDQVIGLVEKNLLINPLFNINQRGYVSGTATGGANQYTVDRWRVVTSGQNLTLSSSQATAPAGGLEQVVEGANIPITGSYDMIVGTNWITVATLGTSAVAANQDGLNVSLTGFSGLTPGQFAFMNYGGAFIDLDAEL